MRDIFAIWRKTHEPTSVRPTREMATLLWKVGQKVYTFFCILSVLVIYFKLLYFTNKLKLIINLNIPIKKYTHNDNDRFKCYAYTGLLTGVVHFHLSVRIIIAVFWEFALRFANTVNGLFLILTNLLLMVSKLWDSLIRTFRSYQPL